MSVFGSFINPRPRRHVPNDSRNGTNDEIYDGVSPATMYVLVLVLVGAARDP